MDREKQKKLERERMEKEHESMVKEDSINNRDGEEGDGPFLPRKSKFVSTQFLDTRRSRLTLCAVPSIRIADVSLQGNDNLGSVWIRTAMMKAMKT